MTGKLYIVGVGPGHHDHMTFRAKEVIEESDTIVGYETYVSLVSFPSFKWRSWHLWNGRTHL